MIGPWQFALVALAAWRTFHLLAYDTILNVWRRDYFFDNHPAIESFVQCPFCLGFWVALAWVAAFWLEPHWTLIVAIPFAVSAAVAMLQLIADALTD